MPAPLRFDLLRDDPARARVAALAALDRGELVVVPTETVYGLAGREDRPAALERLDAVKPGRDKPYSLAVASAEMLAGRLAPWPRGARRIAARWWPGPVTQLLPDRSGRLLGLRVPGHPFTRELAQHAGALWLPSANSPGQPAPREVADIEPAVLAAAAVVLDGGRAALGEASTVVEPRPLCLRVARAGVVGRDELVRHAGSLVLVVCTGNTCRSPMAERLLRRAIQQRAAGEPGLLPPTVRSAGVNADDGGPPAEQAVEALAGLGLDLADHSTRALRDTELLAADLVLCMSAGHALAIEEHLLALGGAERPAVQLFDPAGADVADPFGTAVGQYVALARVLDVMARRRAEQLLSPWRPIP
ncbi:MAG TPA: Sua5/YciO/YrdC/YwlC family protein [Planctomycetota bacterium]|nr:Sua5/YciO/YrdC/YwlC family protein [Planctomycetota bacterium]